MYNSYTPSCSPLRSCQGVGDGASSNARLSVVWPSGGGDCVDSVAKSVWYRYILAL